MELEQNLPIETSKWSKAWPILLTIVITAIIIGGGTYLLLKNEIDTLREEIATLQVDDVVESEDTPTIIDEPTTTTTDSSFLNYKSEELGLSFQYPAKWEEITEGSDHGHLILKSGDDTFLSADNYPYVGPDRGFGWTDLAVLIDGSESIDNFCEDPIFPQNKVRDCEVLTNANGVTYVKTLEEMQAEGGLLGIAHNYYFFNPDSEKSGIVISSIWLDENNLFNLENTLDKLVKSINFTKNNETTAEQTLINFFDSLVNKDYESAVKIFYPTDANGDYDWNMVTQYSDPNKQNTTKAEELSYYCESVGTCLKVEVLSSAGADKDLYAFKVQFRDKDSNIFLYGPFGGITAEQSPPETKFQYYVKKIDGVYKVITPPLYRP